MADEFSPYRLELTKQAVGGFFLHTPLVCGHQGRGHSCCSLWKEQPAPAADLCLLTLSTE